MTQIALGISLNVPKTAKRNCWYCKKKKKKPSHKSNIDRGDVAGWLNKVEPKSDLGWYSSKRYKGMHAEAHHMIPVKSMNTISGLHPYIKKGKIIDDDIGYDLNHPKNSVWLPGRPVPASDKKRIRLINEASSQIHNSGHPDYRANVRTHLTEILQKLNKRKSPKKCPICDKELDKKKKAPYGLVGRLDALSAQLKRLLTSTPAKWKLDEGYYTFSRALMRSAKVWIKQKEI